jgi:uncharacterized protein YkwD
VLDQTNAERTNRGLGPLSLHPQLMQAGNAHFGNQVLSGMLEPLAQRHWWVEPLPPHQGHWFDLSNGWMNSSGHCANILNGSFTNVGIVATPDAFGRMHWTQVCGTPQ